MIHAISVAVSLLVVRSAPMLSTIPLELQQTILTKLSEADLQTVRNVNYAQSQNVDHVLKERHQNWMMQKRKSAYNAAFELIQRAKSKPSSIQQLKHALKLCQESHDVPPLKRRRLMAASGHLDDNLKSVSEYMFESGFANHDAAQLCFNPILFEQEKKTLMEKIKALTSSPGAITTLSLTERQKLLLDLPMFPAQNMGRKFFLTVLQYAIIRNRLDLARLLIQYEPDLERLSEGDIKSPALFFAFGNKEMAQFLISNGADVNGSGHNGGSYLHLAARYGFKDILQLLLENGADIESKESRFGLTPLMIASQSGYHEIVNMLLENGANLDERDKFDRTSLFIACWHGKHDVVISFLKSGADIHLKTNGGWYPIHAAISNGHTHIVQLLLKHGADVDTRTLREDQGNVKSDFGATPLILASMFGHFDIVQLLIKHRADVNAKTHIGITPLIGASESGHFKIVDILLKENAGVNSKDNKNRTSLYYASQNGHIEIVKLLLKHGAVVDLATIRNTAKNNHAQVVLELARASSN